MSLDNQVGALRLVVLLNDDGVRQQALHVDVPGEGYESFKILFCNLLEAGVVDEQLGKLVLVVFLALRRMHQQQLIESFTSNVVKLDFLLLEA